HITGTMTLTSDLIVLRLLGQGQSVHDLTIQIDGAGISGPWGVGGVNVYSPAAHALIERIEVVGGYSFDGARGYGIGTYRPWNDTGGAAQFTTIRDCFIHDGPATGIGINSNDNIDDVDDFTLDWVHILATGETIGGVTATIVAGASTVSSTAIAGTTTTARLT